MISDNLGQIFPDVSARGHRTYSANEMGVRREVVELREILEIRVMGSRLVKVSRKGLTGRGVSRGDLFDERVRHG